MHLCITSCLLLDGWTDLHETLGVYTARPGLLYGVLFYFRSELHNRKIGYFWWTGNWKYRNRKSKICLKKICFCFFDILTREGVRDFFTSRCGFQVWKIIKRRYNFHYRNQQAFERDTFRLPVPIFSTSRKKRISRLSKSGTMKKVWKIGK